jgi:uncharacterized protein
MPLKTTLHPQEVETYYIIPTIRRYVALFLVENGMKQKDVATLLGVNTAAISQYRSNKRGSKIELPEPIVIEIKESARRVKDTFSYFQETQRLLHIIRQTKTLCQIHKQVSFVPENCTPEFMGCSLKGGCM